MTKNLPAALLPKSPATPQPEPITPSPPPRRPLVICVSDERLAKALADRRITAWTVGGREELDVVVIAATDPHSDAARLASILAPYALSPADITGIPNVKLGFYEEPPR